MIFKNLNGELTLFETAEADFALLNLVKHACSTDLPQAFGELDFSGGIEVWMRAVFACNQYVDEQAPWALRKTDPERMRVVLLTLFVAVRDLSLAISPVVPMAAAALLDQLGIAENARGHGALGDTDWYQQLVVAGFKVAQPTGVFPRLELLAEADA